MGYGFPVQKEHKAGESEEIAYQTEGQTSCTASILARSDYGYPWTEIEENSFGCDEWDSQEEETRQTDL